MRAELTSRIDETRAELKEVIWKNTEKITTNNLKIGQNNKRMDRLFVANVQREEHEKLDKRVISLEHEIQDIKFKLAA